jgi:hypothetical protein
MTISRSAPLALMAGLIRCSICDSRSENLYGSAPVGISRATATDFLNSRGRGSGTRRSSRTWRSPIFTNYINIVAQTTVDFPSVDIEPATTA